MSDLKSKTKEELLKIAEVLTELNNRKKYNRLAFMYPDTGPLRRELYPRHIQYLNAGANTTERLFSAGNQTGKTSTLLYEGIVHATGRYPHWWKGKRFKTPTLGIFGCKSWIMARDGLQSKLLYGRDLGYTEQGTGMIPKDLISKCEFISASGTSGCYSIIRVPHKTGGLSEIRFLTYDSGQEAWESATMHWVLLDEEPPRDIYTEAAMRVIKTNGTIAIGFTPDSGLTDTVLHFFKDGQFQKGASEDKFIAMVGWDDVPHISEEAKKRLLNTIPPYLRAAKCKGIPYLGVGRVFPFDIDQMTVEPFSLPSYYEKVNGLDPGINNTAAVFLAIDPSTNVMYVYDEYLVKDQPPEVAALAIRAKGHWITTVADPYYMVQRKTLGVADVRNFLQIYTENLHLDVVLAERNTKESGIEKIRLALLEGRLKIFRGCQRLINQLNLYHRNTRGSTGNTPDDLIDALRYVVSYGHLYAKSYEEYVDSYNEVEYNDSCTERDKITGY